MCEFSRKSQFSSVPAKMIPEIHASYSARKPYVHMYPFMHVAYIHMQLNVHPQPPHKVSLKCLGASCESDVYPHSGPPVVNYD